MFFIFYSGSKSGQDFLEGTFGWGTFKVLLPQERKLIYNSPFGKKGCCLAIFLLLGVPCLFPHLSPTVFGKLFWKTLAASHLLNEYSPREKTPELGRWLELSWESFQLCKVSFRESNKSAKFLTLCICPNYRTAFFLWISFTWVAGKGHGHS